VSNVSEDVYATGTLPTNPPPPVNPATGSDIARYGLVVNPRESDPAHSGLGPFACVTSVACDAQ